jgi:hypothetical protein
LLRKGDFVANLLILRGAPGAGKTDVGTAFEKTYGWLFIELDQIKRDRGNILQFDPGAFVVAGQRAKAFLDAGRDVVVEEFFYNEPLLQLFLVSTGLTTASANVIAVWLECDAKEAANRKAAQGLMTHEYAQANIALAASRYLVPGEVVIDTTKLPVPGVIEILADALRARGIALGR